MSLNSRLNRYARFAWKLPDFLRKRISLDQAKQTISERLAHRHESFLRLVRSCLSATGRNPYPALFKLAGCEYQDVVSLVRTKGLEGTLNSLFEAGIFVSFEESKGRKPIVRHREHIRIHPDDFDNAYLKTAFSGRSSGSTGSRTRTLIDLEYVLDELPVRMLTYDAHQILFSPTVLWRGVLPALSGILEILRSSLIGNLPEFWYTPFVGRKSRFAGKLYLLTMAAVALARCLGRRLPLPRLVELDDPEPIIRWIENTLKTQGECVVRSYVSMAARICSRAREIGLDLEGATFMGGGEPPTEWRVAEIERSGARWVPTYSSAEIGPIAAACAKPIGGNDLHIIKDHVAVIQRPVTIEDRNRNVEALFITTLLPSAPKLLLNVGSDDCATIERRSCGCPLDATGYDEHICNIRSFQKMSGRMITLMDSPLVKVLEQALPARFGGTFLDYQLVENNADDGSVQLALHIDPCVVIGDETEALRLVSDALSRDGMNDSFGDSRGDRAAVLRTKRQPPIIGPNGKFMPLYIMGRSFGPGKGTPLNLFK